MNSEVHMYTWWTRFIFLLFESNVQIITDVQLENVFVEHVCPQLKQSQNLPSGHVILSVKCEKPLGELRVHILLVYHHQNFIFALYM